MSPLASVVFALPAPTATRQHVVAPQKADGVTALVQATDGWLAGDAQKNCDDTCARRGMFCEEAQQQAHVGDVDTADKMNQALIAANVLTISGGVQKQTSCSMSDTNYGSDVSAPMFYQPDWMWPRGVRAPVLIQ